VICPTGAIAKVVSIQRPKNILIFRILDLVYGLLVPLRHEGRTRRHERGAECGGRDCADGRAAWSRTAKSCGPGAPMQAPSSRVGSKGLAPMTVANAGSPGRAPISRKPSRREGRCDHRLYPRFSRSRNFFLREAPGAAATRPSLRPLIFERVDDASLGRNPSRECEDVSTILLWPILPALPRGDDGCPPRHRRNERGDVMKAGLMSRLRTIRFSVQRSPF
jgi:hypothetical protein